MKKLIAILLVFGFIQAQAQAQTRTIYSGNNCQPWRPDYDYRKNSNGFMGNNRASASYQTWDCPIVRQTTNSVQSALVYVNDRGVGTNVQCTLRSIQANGSYYYYSTRTATDPGLYVLQYAGLTAANTGVLTLTCNIPDKSTFGVSGIYSYVIIEQ